MDKKTPAPAVPLYVNLDRRFQPLSETDAEQLEILDMFPEYRSGLTWTDVLAKRRVVILAEAGSGKSKELTQKAAELHQQGKYSFCATLEDVGTRGLEKSLRAKRERFADWKASDAEAWLFLDSIDEAKKARVRLRQALEAIAQDIQGCEGRVHVVLSGRHSDWDFKTDLALVDELLPIPRELLQADVPGPSNDELVLKVTEMEDEEPAEQIHEVAAVLVMLPLDAPRVRDFAIAQGITGADQFLAQLKANNLMGLARRPLDLGWLSDHWRAKGAFGPLSQMLELSLRKRGTEARPNSRAHAPLTADEVMHALDRVGAALVLQRLEHVLIPDDGMAVQQHPRPGIVLNNLLGELSPQQIQELLSRPVFIPVQDGVVRLAQDNKGEVRSLLAARWLLACIRANCPRTVIRDLLFANMYGELVVIPSMQQTAAWLSIWDPEIGQEVAARDPEILVQLGDPASLPESTAEFAFRTLVGRLAKGDRDRVSDHDQIRRLMRPALIPVVRELWNLHKDAEDVRSLLVKCIHYGRLQDLVDIAYEAATAFGTDRLCLVFGGRAVLELAPQPVIRAYVAEVRKHFAVLPATMVWEVAEAAFPGDLSAHDIAKFLATLEESHSELYFERFLRALEGKSVPLDDLLTVLSALTARVPVDEDGPRYDPDRPVSALASLCSLVFAQLGDSEPPAELCTAFLRVNAYEGLRKPDEPLRATAQATAIRRRALLWAAVEQVAQDPDRGGRPDQLWSLHWVHFGPALLQEDIDWLLEDIRTRSHIEDRKLAADAILRIIAGSDERPRLLARIRTESAGLPELASVVEAWDRPMVKSADQIAFETQQQAIKEKHELKRAENKRSWREFFDGIRANPAQLHGVNPLVDADHVESRIYGMWEFVSRSRRNRDRYAIEHLAPLEMQVGTEATVYFRKALSKFWRQWAPTLKSAREPAQRNSMINFDIMGIAGITLDAAEDPQWADGLSEIEARRAAEYATLELNGFPRWIDSLAARWPEVVREVLGKELEAEILATPAMEHLGELQDVSHASLTIQALTADTLYRLLLAHAAMPAMARGRIIAILLAVAHTPHELSAYLLERTRRGKDTAELAADLTALFSVAPDQAVGALKETHARVAKSKRDDLVRSVLTGIAGDGFGKPSDVPATLPFPDLIAFMNMCFAHVRAKEDVPLNTRAVWRRGATRTDAEHARNSLIGYLTKRPGRSSYEALRSLARNEHSPVPPNHALYLAHQRAESDSEFAPWMSEDVARFESEHTFAPQSSQDLCRHAVAIIENIAQKSMTGQFQQGRTLAELGDEKLVQGWIADRFESVAGKRFSVVRESHVADEKEPDITLLVTTTQATAPIEIKVAEKWSVPDLEKALQKQLVGQYLRDADHRWGVLLLVHIEKKARGWRRGNKYLSFNELVEHLKRRAARIAGRLPSSPQPFIAVFDVSTMTKAKETPKNRSKNRSKSRKVRPAKKRAKKTPAKKRKASGR